MRQDECQNTQYWNKATDFLYIYVTVSLENIWLVSLRAVFSVETWWCVALMGLSAGWDWQEVFEACITLWLACMLLWACAENVCQRGKRGLKGVCVFPLGGPFGWVPTRRILCEISSAVLQAGIMMVDTSSLPTNTPTPSGPWCILGLPS